MLSSMGFGGAGVFVEAHLVAVCCKRVPRRARRGAERALWDMVGARVVGKRAADTPFFGNHPESSRSNKQPKERAAMSVVPHAITPAWRHTGTGRNAGMPS